jgi:ABC-2 type transport system permease protein
MRRIWTICARELRSQVVSPVGWIVGAGFLLLAGYFFFNLVSSFSVILNNYSAYAQITQNPSLVERVNLNEIVVAGFFGNVLILLLFLVPALTMRSFAEERKQGTDELLLTAPVSPGQIVAGKFLGLAVPAVALVGSTVLFIAILARYGDPEMGPVWTGLLGLMLATVAMVSLGMAVSASTESQAVAGFGAFVVLLMLYVVDFPAEAVGSGAGEVLKSLSLRGRFEGFVKGVVATPDVVYYLSLAALGLVATRAIVASQRWR